MDPKKGSSLLRDDWCFCWRSKIVLTRDEVRLWKSLKKFKKIIRKFLPWNLIISLIYRRRRSASFALKITGMLGKKSSVRHLNKLCSFRDFECLNLFVKVCQSSSVKQMTCQIRSVPCFCLLLVTFLKSSRYSRVPLKGSIRRYNLNQTQWTYRKNTNKRNHLNQTQAAECEDCLPLFCSW